mmetsp:Transcript_95598/g.169761  ORF Transcript_95598/g.169761 Transcript_95598/m.169761 type:complete len:224 (-) Transcript_95598:52-723(-)
MFKLFASLMVVSVRGFRESVRNHDSHNWSVEVNLCEHEEQARRLVVDFKGDACLAVWDPFGGYRWQGEKKDNAEGSFELRNWSSAKPFMAMTWGKSFRKRYSAHCETGTILRTKYISEPNLALPGSQQYHQEKNEYMAFQSFGEVKYRGPVDAQNPLKLTLSSQEETFLLCIPEGEVQHTFPIYHYEPIPTEAQNCTVDGDKGYVVKLSGEKSTAVSIYTLSY